jgi:hypothetical protein
LWRLSDGGGCGCGSCSGSQLLLLMALFAAHMRGIGARMGEAFQTMAALKKYLLKNSPTF